MAKAVAKVAKAAKAAVASIWPTKEQLATEKKRAEALAKQYGGNAELLTLAEASKLHPDLALKAEDMANTAYFHLRFRPCTICGRFPSRAIVHYRLHEDRTLNAKGNRTDPEARKAIAERVAKALATINGEKKPTAKPKAKAAKATKAPKRAAAAA